VISFLKLTESGRSENGAPKKGAFYHPFPRERGPRHHPGPLPPPPQAIWAEEDHEVRALVGWAQHSSLEARRHEEGRAQEVWVGRHIKGLYF